MPTDDEWQQRLRAAVAATLQARADRAAVRLDLDARRQAGLAARHRSKLARNRQEDTVPDVPPPPGLPGGRPLPPCCAEADEPPCPQHQQQGRVVQHQGPRNRSGRAFKVFGDSGKARPVGALDDGGTSTCPRDVDDRTRP